MKNRLSTLVSNLIAAVRGWPRRRLVVTLLLLVTAIVLGEYALDSWDGKNSVTTYLERKEAGKKIRLKHYIATGLTVGSAVNALLAAMLVVTSGWWLAAAGGERRLLKRPVSDLRPVVFWSLLVVVMAVALLVRLPRMDLGLYTDEEYTLRKYVRGIVERPEPGAEPIFKPVDWRHTLWANPMSNNQVLFSLLSRASLTGWQGMTGQDATAFDETIFRLPSLLGGVASLLVLALLMRSLGFARAGVWAAALLAVHPWHIRYSTEGRGYGLMFLFFALTTLFLVRALTDGRWRWWLAFAAAQLLMLLSYAGTMYIAVAQGLAVIGAITWLGRSGFPWREQGMRFLVASCVTVMGVIQLQVPWALQIIHYLGGERARGTMDVAWFQDFWGYLSLGMMWRSDAPDNPLHITLTRMAEQGSPVFWVSCVVLPLLLIVGAVRLARSSPIGALLVVVFLAAAPLGYWHNAANEQKLYLWYLVFALPGMFALVALGCDWPLLRLRNRRGGEWLAAGISLLVVVGFVALTKTQTQTILHHGKEQFREAIGSLRGGNVDPAGLHEAEAITAAFFSEAPFYDPHALVLRRGPDVVAAMAEADRSGRPLLVTYGRRTLCEQRLADIIVYADDPKLFEPIAVFYGLEEQQFTHYTLRYIGKPPRSQPDVASGSQSQ